MEEFFNIIRFKTSKLDPEERIRWEAGTFPSSFEAMPEFVRDTLVFKRQGYAAVHTELSSVGEIPPDDLISVNPDDPADVVIVDERCFWVLARYLAEPTP